jgi:ABC-type Fe3+/spermidine/putrescine transport system ATPase subunit
MTTSSSTSPRPGDAAAREEGHALEVRQLVKTFITDHGAVNAIDDVSFTVGAHEFVTLLGPSGCGKSTVLRCVAGLEKPNSGTIVVHGKVVRDERTSTRPHARGLGFVFQNYAIWPHMTVRQNVSFGLDRRLGQEEVENRVREALDMVGIGELADRKAAAMSGGQQQRVAIARAVAAAPQLLLLDEPFSNLDAKLRQRMRSELKRVHEITLLPMLYVTHDQEEALAMSDRILVMRAGHAEQEGVPEHLLKRPATRFVADFIGATSVLRGVIREHGDDRTVVRVHRADIVCNLPDQVGPPHSEVEVVLRPWFVDLCDPTEAVWNGKILSRTYLGSRWSYEVELGEDTLHVEVLDEAASPVRDVGDNVGMRLRPGTVPMAFPSTEPAASSTLRA